MSTFLCACMFSCVNSSNGSTLSNTGKDTIPIEKFALEFLRNNPNFDNNEITRQKASDSFKQLFSENANSLDLLSGIPVEFVCAKKCHSDSSYMVQFQAWHRPSSFYYKNFEKVMIDIVTKVSEKEVESLKEKEYYYLKCHFVSIIQSIPVLEAFLGRKTIIITDKWGLQKKRTS